MKSGNLAYCQRPWLAVSVVGFVLGACVQEPEPRRDAAIDTSYEDGGRPRQDAKCGADASNNADGSHGADGSLPDRSLPDGPLLPARSNLLPNSGFELGRLRLAARRLGVTGEAAIERGNAYEGRQCLRISVLPTVRETGYQRKKCFGPNPDCRPYLAQLEGVRVAAGKPYVLSVWIKGKKNMRASIGAVTGGRGTWVNPLTTDFVDVGPQYRRLTLRIPASHPYGEVPGLLPTLFVDSKDDGPGDVFFDGLKLEQGDEASRYVPRAGLDLGVTTREPLNIFNTNAATTIEAIVAIRNGDAIKAAATLSYIVKNWQGSEINKGSFNIDIRAGETVSRAVNLGDLPKGYYIADFALRPTGSNMGGASEQRQWLRIAVINKRPLPYDDKTATESFFGMHWGHTTPEISRAMAAAGARWHKGYQSPVKENIDYIYEDPPKGTPKLRWGMSYMNRLVVSQSNLKSYTCLNGLPAWIDGVKERLIWCPTCNPKTPAEMATYIRGWVRDNRSWVGHIESHNEVYGYIPLNGGDVRPFMDYFRLFYQSVKAEDPTMQVIHNVVYDVNSIYNLLDSVMAAGLAKYMDVLSFHYYGYIGAGDPEEYLGEKYIKPIQTIMKRHKAGAIPIWMTEGGGTFVAEDDPHYDRKLFFPSFNINTNEQGAANLLVRFHLVGLAMGIERFFVFLVSEGIPSENNWVGMGLFRWDGQPRLKYVAYAHMTELLEDARFETMISANNDAVRFYLFRKHNDVVVAYAKGLNGISGDMQFPASSVIAAGMHSDVVGGILKSARSSHFDDSPRYVLARNATPSKVTAEIRSAAFSNVKRPKVRPKVPDQPPGTMHLIEAEAPMTKNGGEIDHRPGHYDGRALKFQALNSASLPVGGFSVKYEFFLVGNGDYTPWICGWPTPRTSGGKLYHGWVSPLDYRIDGGAWIPVSSEKVYKSWSSDGYNQPGVHDKFWMTQRTERLVGGRHTIELRLKDPRPGVPDNPTRYVGLLDAIAIVKK